MIEAARARVGQRGEAVEPVGRDVAAQLRPSPPRCLLLRAFDVGRLAAHRWPTQRRLEAAATLARLRVERERPTCLVARYHI